MKILAIESSCDETAAAVVENGTKIISNIVASSIDIHAKTGGIIPESAARQQLKSIIPVIDKSLKDSEISLKDIDAIAVTVGPGLIGSLLVGVETAKTLSVLWKKPIIPINHLVGHIYANFIHQTIGSTTPRFPAIALVVSGGHTDLVFMKGHGKLKWIGGTRDDAAGEAFDKTARLLGLTYPGGPSIAYTAEKFKNKNIKTKIQLPRPMINDNNFDFSFSGLKTAVLRTVKATKNIEKKAPELAFEIQEAITDVLTKKTLKAVEKFKPKSLLLAGGVAANMRLREKLESEINKSKTKTILFIPPPKLCTDNAVYIASCAFYNFKKVDFQNIDTQPELSLRN